MSDEAKEAKKEVQEERHYYSQRPSLKFRLDGRRESFKNGVFVARGRDQIAAMEKALAGMSPSARAEIKTVSAERAVQIARQHQKALGQAAFQGGMTTAARAKEINRVRELMSENELRDQNLQQSAQNAVIKEGSAQNLGGVETENLPSRVNIKSGNKK